MREIRVTSPEAPARRSAISCSLGVLVSLVAATSCGATTYDASMATSTSTVSTSTTVPTGTTEELLENLATAMSGLSILIGPDSSGRTPAGKNEQIASITALWDAVRSAVTAADEEAADALERMVALARTAVDRNRPADADKAARFAGQVIDKFLGNT